MSHHHVLNDANNMRTPDNGNQQVPDQVGHEHAGGAWDHRTGNAVAQPQMETPGEDTGALGEFGSPTEVELGAELWSAPDLYQDHTAAAQDQAVVQYYDPAAQDQIAVQYYHPATQDQIDVRYYQPAAQDQINANTNTSWQSAFFPGLGYNPASGPLQEYADGTQVSPSTPALNAAPVYEPQPTLPPAPPGDTDAILSTETQTTLLPHQCMNCPKAFPSNNKLHRHIRGEHWQYRYRCWCGSTNTRKDNYLRHWGKHKNRGEHCTPATIRSSMICGFCGLTTVDAGAHRAHVQSCGDGMPGRPSGSKNGAK